jgi:transposase
MAEGKKGQQSKGRSISGLTTKLHLAITPDFRIIEGFLTGGNKADISFADELSAGIYDCYIIEDKGYDSNSHRANLSSNNNIPVIPGRRNRIEPIIYDKEKFKMRSRIENFFAMLKENRRLALRYEKSDLSFLSFISIATIKHNLC